MQGNKTNWWILRKKYSVKPKAQVNKQKFLITFCYLDYVMNRSSLTKTSNISAQNSLKSGPPIMNGSFFKTIFDHIHKKGETYNFIFKICWQQRNYSKCFLKQKRQQIQIYFQLFISIFFFTYYSYILFSSLKLTFHWPDNMILWNTAPWCCLQRNNDRQNTSQEKIYCVVQRTQFSSEGS